MFRSNCIIFCKQFLSFKKIPLVSWVRVFTMTTWRKILLAQKFYDFNYTMQDFSPFIFFLVHEILQFFVNCLIKLKSQCKLLPFIKALLVNFWIFVIKNTWIWMPEINKGFGNELKIIISWLKQFSKETIQSWMAIRIKQPWSENLITVF